MRLPPEILLEIFSLLCERECLSSIPHVALCDYYGPSASSLSRFHNQLSGHFRLSEITLMACAVVCKAWAVCAEQVLYSHIRLNKLRSCRILLRTLKKKPQVGEWVKELYLPRIYVKGPRSQVTFDCDNAATDMQTTLYRTGRTMQGILQRCPNVVFLRASVYQCPRGSPRRLIPVGYDGLRHITRLDLISARPNDKFEGSPGVNFEALEDLSLAGYLIEQAWSDIVRMCPKVHTIRFWRCSLVPLPPDGRDDCTISTYPINVEFLCSEEIRNRPDATSILEPLLPRIQGFFTDEESEARAGLLAPDAPPLTCAKFIQLDMSLAYMLNNAKAPSLTVLCIPFYNASGNFHADIIDCAAFIRTHLASLPALQILKFYLLSDRRKLMVLRALVICLSGMCERVGVLLEVDVEVVEPKGKMKLDGAARAISIAKKALLPLRKAKGLGLVMEESIMIRVGRLK